MLSSVRKFFEQRINARPGEAAAPAEDRAKLAAAALLVEVVRSDDQFSAVERDSVLGSVQRKFGIEAEAARQLLELAEVEARDAHDTYQFTSMINAGFTDAQKGRLIEELWRVAYADSVLHRHEEHLIRRIADLIHVPHSTFIRAKLRAQEDAAQA